ncbi:alcohol dehydrogenase catalytic domain-containing protein [Actinoplanes sp. KI2]|uniref:zinc-dependent alcohol dehydrogenase n=1 Tax=Actinoplanes sp. KI2 TaxID=2983315 RepID=UPI0021D6152E|nr:alcohol dehydrogenase catalytic domain-containing protein [Actinoplanes sp. KI2]MCU7729349.1 alcohol dehydrogenase catalytic domain-containing protein [Actinoplanes sp. KI2]
MKAAAYHGHGRLETVTLDVEPPGPGQLQIAVAYCGLCGTDLHIVHGDMDSRVRMPLVFGHETAGRVAAIGPGVRGWSIGDPVTVLPLIWDGTCAACLAGHQHICQNLVFVGIDSPGGLQQRWNVPASIAVPLPPGLDLRTAALVEPVAVAVHDVRRSELQIGDRAVVLGGGPIGVLIAAVARDAGADVLVAEVDPTRRGRIAELGFRVIDPGSDDLAGEVERWTAGVGADVVFEVSGAAAAARSTTVLAKVRGTIVVVAIHAAPREIDLQRVFWRELRLLGTRVYQRSDFDRAIELLARGRVPVDALISAVVPLEETASAIADLSAGRAMKILVDVAGEAHR